MERFLPGTYEKACKKELLDSLDTRARGVHDAKESLARIQDQLKNINMKKEEI